ncbi:MAG TPA: hypothetical protein VIV60_05615 [Polyangiaceae bacterium]
MSVAARKLNPAPSQPLKLEQALRLVPSQALGQEQELALALVLVLSQALKQELAPIQDLALALVLVLDQALVLSHKAAALPVEETSSAQFFGQPRSFFSSRF